MNGPKALEEFSVEIYHEDHYITRMDILAHTQAEAEIKAVELTASRLYAVPE